MKYVEKESNPDHCPFCEAYSGNNDPDNLVIFRGKNAFVIGRHMRGERSVCGCHPLDPAGLFLGTTSLVALEVNVQRLRLMDVTGPEQADVAVGE